MVAIAAGLNHSLALKADGTVVAWGFNPDGQSTIPAGLTGVISIAAGGNFSLALTDGAVPGPPVITSPRRWTTEAAGTRSTTAQFFQRITATGSPAIIYAEMLKPGAVVVDAGVASEDGKTVGDVAPDVFERDDLTLTPKRGGVGPLTVCALFDNVIRAARLTVPDATN